MGKNILFVNSCIRKNNISRTYKLAEAFINKYKALNPNDTVNELKLNEMDLKCVCGDFFEKREKLIASKNFNNSMFDLAKEFAYADKIIVAAPLWELSFPSVLKVYIENIAIAGIAFGYNENGNVGLCKAEKLLYITTRGGYFNEKGDFDEMGSIYMNELCKMFGIDKYLCIYAEGLDIEENNIEEIMQDSIFKALKLAETF